MNVSIKNADILEEVPDEHIDMYVEARGTLKANDDQLWSLLSMGLSPEALELVLEHEGYDFEHKETLSTEDKENELVQYYVYDDGEKRVLETKKAFGYWQVKDLR